MDHDYYGRTPSGQPESNLGFLSAAHSSHTAQHGGDASSNASHIPVQGSGGDDSLSYGLHNFSGGGGGGFGASAATVAGIRGDAAPHHMPPPLDHGDIPHLYADQLGGGPPPPDAAASLGANDFYNVDPHGTPPPPLPPARVNAFGTIDGQHSEMSNSPPTSPPSSVAPASEDEFTTFLLRRAAKQLGVDYTPASSSGYKAIVGGSPPRDNNTPSKSVLENYNNSLQQGAAGMHHPADQSHHQRSSIRGTPGAAGGKSASKHTPYSETPVAAGASVNDIQHMVKIRTKALGENHPSVCLLFVALGDRLVLDGQSAKAEAAYTTALERQEKHFGANAAELVPTISKMGTFFAQHEKYVQSKVMFQRAASIMDLLSGGYGDADDGQVRQQTEKEKETEEAEALRGILANLREEREREKERQANDESPSSKSQQVGRGTAPIHERLKSRNLVAAGLLSSINRAAANIVESDANKTPPPTKETCEVQTEDTVDMAYVRDMAAKHGVGMVVSEAVPPKPVVLTAEQRARIRQPTLRTAEDLKKLLSFVSSSEPIDTANNTKQMIQVTSPSRPHPHQHQVEAAIDHQMMLSPKSAAAQRQAAALQETVDIVSRDHGRVPDSFDPVAATEREVARMIISASPPRH